MTGRPSGGEAEIGRPSTRRMTKCEPHGPPHPRSPRPPEYTVQNTPPKK